MNQSHKFHCFGVMKIYSYLLKNQEKWKIILKSKKIHESAYLNRKVTSLLKTGFLVTLNPKERRIKEMI